MALDEIKIWAMDGPKGATPLEMAAQVETERLLEDTLVKNPEMLMPGLTLVGRQTPTEGGPLDLLGVDEDGRLVVFELKRGSLSREAIAQVIDYASYLGAMPDQELANYISQRSGSHSTERIENFEEWHDAKSGGQGFERTETGAHGAGWLGGGRNHRTNGEVSGRWRNRYIAPHIPWF